MRILLVRHAEPDYARDSLTPKGRREAELLSQRLCRLNVKAFYVSPLGRAQDVYKRQGAPRPADYADHQRPFRRCEKGRHGRGYLPYAEEQNPQGDALGCSAIDRPKQEGEDHT